MPGPDSGPSTSGSKRRSSTNEELVPKFLKTSEDNDNEYRVTSKCIQTAFGGKTSTYRVFVESSAEISDPRVIFNQAQKLLRNILHDSVEKLQTIKAVFNLHCCFVNNQYNEFDIKDSIVISSGDENVIDAHIQSAKNCIFECFNTYDLNTEGEKEILYLDLHINEHNIPNNMFVETEGYLKRHIVSVASALNSNESFKWAVLAALHPEIYDPKDYLLEEYSDELILTDIQHPVKIQDIPKIEEMNDMSFNVFIMKYNFYPNKREEIEGPIYHTAQRKDKHFNLLLLHDGPSDFYCYIKNLRSAINPDKSGSFCDGCLSFFRDGNVLKRHQKLDCLRMKTVTKPDSEKIMKFKPDNGITKLPIVIYADFEAYLEPVNSKSKTTQKDTYTENISKHVPYSFAYFIKCVNNELSTLKTYYGSNCAENFMKRLSVDVENICKKFCDEDIPVIPVFFHNFSGYDSHFVCHVLDKVPGYMSAMGSINNFIALHKTLVVKDKNSQEFKVQLRFLDSLGFLKGPLEELAKCFDREKFIESRNYWDDDEKFNLMIQKGSFPYEYVKSLENLEETSLPPKELFYSSVKNAHITDEEYDRALEVWEIFECENLRDYAMEYLKSDVLILADLFENLRCICLDAYNLDPAKYYSIPSLSWDAMLLKTEIQLELLTDVEMITFINRAKRSGIAHCTKRHAVANNDYLDTYDESKEDNFIMYYDANNLYGWAMSQPLPYGGFVWVKNCSVEWVMETLSDFPSDSRRGYYLEVDLEYPEELHDKHADLPFCPEKKAVPNCDGDRLVTDLLFKKRYVLHHSYLIQCLKHGLGLKKVHRVLRFKQHPWLKPFIDYNTDRRAEATTAAEKDFYKLMNNSIYGKSIQNDSKYHELKLLDHWPKYGKKHGTHSITGRADCNNHAVMAENLVAIQLNKTKCEFKMPIYIGISILDLSKAHMYEFHYSFMKKQYGKKLKLLYTDTDSFIYQIFTKDYYNEMSDSLDEHFDTSDYPDDSLFQSQANKKKVGFFKDELNGDVIKEFIALRPKVYMIEAKNKTIVKAAGVPKNFQKFTMKDYKKCLFKQTKIYMEITRIKPVGHEIYTQKARKVVLSPAYLNRHTMENLIDTLPFGHYSLMES